MPDPGDTINSESAIEIAFDKMLKRISRKMRPLQVRQFKEGLIGHVDHNMVDTITNGYQLICILIYNKLLSETKLAFFQKLLQNVDGNEKLLNLIKEFQNVARKVRIMKEISPKVLAQDLQALEMIKERHDVSLSECNTMLDKLHITISELTRCKLNQTEEIKALTAELDQLKTDKGNMKERYDKYQQLVDSKRESILLEQDVLTRLKQERDDFQNKKVELQVKLNTKGEFRLNTFQRTLHKEEINNTENLINQSRRRVLDQKHLLMDLDDELDFMYCKLDTRRKKIRTISEEIQSVHLKLISVYENLQDTCRNLVEIVDEQSYYKESITEINHSIETTCKEIAKKQESSLKCTVVDDEKTIKEIDNLISRTPTKLDYKLVGRNIYTIGEDPTKMGDEKLQQPVSVNIDQNGNIIVADSVEKCVYKFTIHGVLNLRIDLNTLQPVDLTIDALNNYVVCSKAMIRVYRQEHLLKQFLPLYVANRMEMPELISIDYNKYTNELLLLDRTNKSVQMFRTNGRYLRTKDISETTDHPSRICVTGEQSFTVTDSQRHCVNIYEYNGVLKCVSYGMFGIGLCEFVKPQSILCDDDQNLFVCDTGNHRICVIDYHGNQITSFGHLGTSKSCFNSPIDLAIHASHGIVIVADRDNHRLVVYL